MPQISGTGASGANPPAAISGPAFGSRNVAAGSWRRRGDLHRRHVTTYLKVRDTDAESSQCSRICMLTLGGEDERNSSRAVDFNVVAFAGNLNDYRRQRLEKLVQ
jgi:hypothetical protein